MRISLKRRRVLLEIDQLTDLHAKEVMYHASSYRKYTSPKSLDSVAIIQRLSPMTATRHGLQMSYLNDRGVDHRCLLYHYESIKPHCAKSMASYCEMKYRKKLSEGTVWRACDRVTWSKGTLTWDWSFTDLTSVQNRSMCVQQWSTARANYWGISEIGRLRHKKEKKRKSWQWNGASDELSRSGELEETQHVFNAALILRRAICIQSLQPITPVSSWARRSVWRENWCTCSKWVV